MKSFFTHLLGLSVVLLQFGAFANAAREEVLLPHPRADYLDGLVYIHDWKIPCSSTTGGSGFVIKGIGLDLIDEVKIGGFPCAISGTGHSTFKPEIDIYRWGLLICEVPAYYLAPGIVDVSISVRLNQYHERFEIPQSFYYHTPHADVGCNMTEPEIK